MNRLLIIVKFVFALTSFTIAHPIGGFYYTAQEDPDGEKCWKRNMNWENDCGFCHPGFPEEDWHYPRQKCLQSGCCYADDAMEMH